MERRQLSYLRMARNRTLAASALLGGLAAGLTLSIERLTYPASSIFVHALQTAALALMIPGVLIAFTLGKPPGHLPYWIAALFNFAFWFGFAWLFGFLLGKLRQQIRILASHLSS